MAEMMDEQRVVLMVLQKAAVMEAMMADEMGDTKVARRVAKMAECLADLMDAM